MSCNNISSNNTIDQTIFGDAKRDLETIKAAANSKDLLYESRTGGDIRTLQGRLSEISGYQPINGGVWASGVEFTGYDQYAIYQGTAYKLKASTELPETSQAEPSDLFEPFTVVTTSSEVARQVDEYNKTNLGDFTDYVFSTVSKMIEGKTIGEKSVVFKEGQSLTVVGQGNEASFFTVTSVPTPVAISPGLYAKEVFAKISEEGGSNINPISGLNPDNDASNFPKPSFDMNEFTGTIVADGYSGGVLSQQNNIYFMNNNVDNILKLNPITGVIFKLNSTVTGRNYTSSALASNGFIYSASTSSDKILKVNPFNDTHSEVTGLSGSNLGFDGIVVSDNGSLYLVPSSSTKAVRFDPVTELSTYIGTDYGSDVTKWAGGALAPNGKIYCAPFDNNNILEINPADDTTRLIPTPAGEEFGRFKGVVLGTDGMMYFIPYNDTRAMRLNPSNDSVDLLSFVFTGTNKYIGGVLGVNNKIYFIPHNSDKVAELDIESSSIILYDFPESTGTNNFYGAVSDTRGMIFCCPSNTESRVMQIGGLPGGMDWQISAYSNKY